MSVSAQDIALVITTLTTAATAFAGLILPVINSRTDRIRKVNMEIHARFRLALDDLLNESRKKEKATKEQLFDFAKGSIATKFGTKYEFKEFSDDFDVAGLRLDLLGSSYGVDTSLITNLLDWRASIFYKYWQAAVAGETDKAQAALVEAIKAASENRKNLAKAVAELWASLAEKFPTT